MKVVLDNIIFSLQRTGGISGAWAKIVGQLLTRKDLDLRFVERGDALSNLHRQALDIPSELILPRRTLPLVVYRYLPVRVEGEEPFIFHSSYYRRCSNACALNVITLHDFIYEQAGCHSWLARAVHTRQKGSSIRGARGIVSVSDVTLRLLKSLYNVSGGDVLLKVIGNPVVCRTSNMTSSRVAAHGGHNDYVLYVGGRERYKNFYLAAEAAAISGRPLVVAGAALSRTEARCLKHLSVDYKVVTYPSESELGGLYSEAFCLIYPSAFEGFGIPVIEAQAHGCPVIIGPCEACRQTAGQGALVSAGFSAAAFAECMRELDEPGLRALLSASGFENIARFEVSHLAGGYVEFYHALVDKFC